MRSEVVLSFDDEFKNRRAESHQNKHESRKRARLVLRFTRMVVFARRRDATRVRLDDTYHTYTPSHVSDDLR